MKAASEPAGSDVQKHVLSCEACRTLLKNLHPKPIEVERFAQWAADYPEATPIAPKRRVVRFAQSVLRRLTHPFLTHTIGRAEPPR